MYHPERARRIPKKRDPPILVGMTRLVMALAVALAAGCDGRSDRAWVEVKNDPGLASAKYDSRSLAIVGSTRIVDVELTGAVSAVIVDCAALEWRAAERRGGHVVAVGSPTPIGSSPVGLVANEVCKADVTSSVLSQTGR